MSPAVPQSAVLVVLTGLREPAGPGWQEQSVEGVSFCVSFRPPKQPGPATPWPLRAPNHAHRPPLTSPLLCRLLAVCAPTSR